VVGVLDGKGNTDPVRVDTTPGVRFSYSGGGYTVMQLLLTDVTGQSFTDLMRQRVLAPTGMQRSTYAQPLPEARWPEAATGYRPSGEPVEEQWHVYPEQAAAGLWTTPTELLTWALAIRRAYAGATGEVLTPAMAKQMLTPDAHHWGLGPGFDDRDLSFGHGGANEGFRCQLVLLLDGSGGVAVMTNSDEGSPLVAEIAATVAADYGWPIRHPEERTVATLDSATLADLAGQYDVPGAGVVNVTADTNRLLLTLPDGRKVTLLPESADTLFDRDDGQRFTVVRQAGRVVAFEVSGTQAKKVK
jgi:hypothetical protein